MSSWDPKTLLESGLGLLAKEYEKNLCYRHTHMHECYEHTRMHDNMVPWALRALGTKSK